MVKDETLLNENEMFKVNLDEKLIPQIRERIENKENRIEYTENEIKQILEVEYNTENLYQRFKTILLNTEIGISIKRIAGNNKFIFFRRLEGVKRDSDLFKSNFEQLIKPKLLDYLDVRHPCIGIPEEWLKDKLDGAGYTTGSIYNKLKYILAGTEITVSTLNKGGNKGFIFYNKRLEAEHDAWVDKKVEEHEQKRKVILEEERQEELKRLDSDDLYSEIASKFPPPPLPMPSKELVVNEDSPLNFYEKGKDDSITRNSQTKKNYKFLHAPNNPEKVLKGFTLKLYEYIKDSDGVNVLSISNYFNKTNNYISSYLLRMKDYGLIVKENDKWYLSKEGDSIATEGSNEVDSIVTDINGVDSIVTCPICGLEIVMFSQQCHSCKTILTWKEEQSD